MSEEKEYDGLYFLPGDEDYEIRLQYFTLTDPELKGEPINNTKVGDMFHVAFFRQNEDGNPVFDEEFEAIFADPTTYIEKSILGTKLYGCMFRKTKNSHKWWESYLSQAKKSCEQLMQKGLISANT